MNNMGEVKIRVEEATDISRAELNRSITSAETAYLAVQALTLDIISRIDFNGGSLDREGILVGLHGLFNAINVLNKYASDVEEIANRMTPEASSEYMAATSGIKAMISAMRRSTELGIAEMPDAEVGLAIDGSGQLTEHEMHMAKVVLYNQRLMELRAYLAPIAAIASLRR